ncbi:hypothetical protein V8E52_009766 [Russula decolorans]|jgi:hypothetical protein
MDRVPRSCPNHHGPDGCTCLPLQEHQHQQRQLHHPPAALPLQRLQCLVLLLDLAFTFLLARRQPNHSMHLTSLTTIMTVHDFTIFMEPIYGNAVYSQPYGQSSNSQLHLPSHCSIFNFILLLLLNKIPGKVPLPRTLAENVNRHQPKITQPRKRPRVPAVPTTERPSLICGVGPPTTIENHSPPSTPVRLSSTASCSVSASFQLPTHKQRSTEHSAAATDVWYFCRPQNSPTKTVS